MDLQRSADDESVWPPLPLPAWRDTCDTLHMWTQVVGKIRLALAPWINHSWGSALYVTTRGLTTSPIPYGTQTFAIDFDFVDHVLRVTTSRGIGRSFELVPMPVADFYGKTMAVLQTLGLNVAILARPVEIEEAIPFAEDHRHASYDSAAVHRWWLILVQTNRVFTQFRSRFIGKVSPVHFFWGAFDLAVTRFSGRPAPPHPGGVPNCADWVMREAYSHEVSSAGFWPGAGLGEPAFYSYAYPEPDGYRNSPIRPSAAYYHEGIREFILPYEAVRTAAEPDQALLEFLQTTYDAAATSSNWDRDLQRA
jgi:hypothetical protein